MNLTDHNLLDALRLLTPAERAAVGAHVQGGKRTAAEEVEMVGIGEGENV
jgi:hypothetical protein